MKHSLRFMVGMANDHVKIFVTGAPATSARSARALRGAASKPLMGTWAT